MYYRWCERLQQNIEEERKSAETFGPRRQNPVERAVQQKLEQFNLRGFYVQVDREKEEERVKRQGISAFVKWPWDYPRCDWSQTTLRKWERTKKFHNLM